MCTNIVLCKVINYQMNLNFDFVNHSDITPSLETQTIPGLSKPKATCAKLQQTTRQTADKKAVPGIIQANGIWAFNHISGNTNYSWLV